MSTTEKMIEVPVYPIPDRDGPHQAAYFEGLFILNALFRAYGTVETVGNTGMMPTHEVVDALTMALALQMANDDRCTTPRDARLMTDAVSKRLKQLVKGFMENEKLKPVVDASRMTSFRPN